MVDSTSQTKPIAIPKPFPAETPFHALSDDEIESFYNEIDTKNEGFVRAHELQRRLEDVYDEIAPETRKQHRHHLGRSRDWDIEQGENVSSEHDGLQAFIRSLMPEGVSDVSKPDFIKRVRSWNVPSPAPLNSGATATNDHPQVFTRWRRMQAYWNMRSPRILFMTFVFLLTLGMTLWPLFKYANNPLALNAFGWGVVIGKACAGALYPSLFFMILSMSRWFATACRRFYYLSRFVNWDRHQSFHIWMACSSLVLATVHAIAHMSGTFNFGTRPAHWDAIAAYLGPQAAQRTYRDYINSLPGWSGLLALGLFWMIALLSSPFVRKRSYEIFQASHLLMFPVIGLLCAHGTLRLLQYPMLGFWLVIPSILVISERLHRLYRGFIKIPTAVDVLDDGTVTLTCRQPNGRPWRYTAGQYVLVQVPSLSFWQWHPFTISACKDDILQLHIKSSGDWTSKLQSIRVNEDFSVGIDGPFGAPAQRFYEYDRAIVVGAGIGITPFAAILTDLEMNLQRDTDPWAGRRSSIAASWRSRGSLVEGWRNSMTRAREGSVTESHQGSAGIGSIHHPSAPGSERGSIVDIKSTEPSVPMALHSSTDIKMSLTDRKHLPPVRRVDFHWLVREEDNLLWFSSLLNRAYDLSLSPSNPGLALNITTHITVRRGDIAQYILRYLLDAYRSPTQLVSAFTGLRMRSSFGRPEFDRIIASFYDDLLRETRAAHLPNTARDKQKVIGVFFCGPPMIGEILSSLCVKFTNKARADGQRFRFEFRNEVFS